MKNRVTRDSLDFLPFSPSACPPQSETYPGNKIGRAVSGIADEIIDSSRVDSSKRGIDFFFLSLSLSLPPFLSAPNFSQKLRKTLETVRVSEQFVDVYMFSRIHSLNFHRKFHWFCATQQVAFSFFEKKKSIYSPPSLPLFVPARCSVSLARHGKPRNDFNHVNEIA